MQPDLETSRTGNLRPPNSRPNNYSARPDFPAGRAEELVGPVSLWEEEHRRDDFPAHFVGDLVPTERGWVVVPPTSCPNGHDYGEDRWSVS